MSYSNKLQEMGIVASRVEDIELAISGLHCALCKLDNSQLKAFSANFGIIGHLDIYAREEELRNVAVDMYNNNLRAAVKKIDFHEFPNFSDKLFFLAEEAAELSIPGAKQLCKSLIDIRKNYEMKRMLFSALAIQAENIAKVNGVLSCESLEIRLTHKYKDAYRYLDDSQRIGTVGVLRSVNRHEDSEYGESGSNLLFVKVLLDEDLEFPVDYQTVKDALRNHFSYHGCSHEHDCCGCISQSVNRMKLLRVNGFSNSQIYAISVSWYRNC